MFTLFGSVICWKANIQHVAALSSTEVEYIVVTEAVKEALWIKGMINWLGENYEVLEVHCDNQSVIRLTKH